MAGAVDGGAPELPSAGLEGEALEIGGESGAAAQESLVSRRYSEFRKLEKAICDVFEGLPPVPGKTISRHGSSAAGAGEGGQTRLDGLTRFLGELPEQAGSGRNRHVLQFLGVISA